MRKRAQTTETPEHREAWARVADQWDALAREVETFAPTAPLKAKTSR